MILPVVSVFFPIATRFVRRMSQALSVFSGILPSGNWFSLASDIYIGAFSKNFSFLRKFFSVFSKKFLRGGLWGCAKPDFYGNKKCRRKTVGFRRHFSQGDGGQGFREKALPACEYIAYVTYAAEKRSSQMNCTKTNSAPIKWLRCRQCY